jgi:hypothetical protein
MLLTCKLNVPQQAIDITPNTTVLVVKPLGLFPGGWLAIFNLNPASLCGMRKKPDIHPSIVAYVLVALVLVIGGVVHWWLTA